jgi:hypothetical protein
MKKTVFFKDVPAGAYFFESNKSYKKMDYEHAKDIFSYELIDFYPMDVVEIDKTSKFQLNF